MVSKNHPSRGKQSSPTTGHEVMTKPGVIAAGCSYTLPEFMARAGLQNAALKTAKKNGLIIRYHARRGYVLGSDWLDFLAKAPLEHSGARK